MIRQDEVLRLLSNHQAELRQFGVRSLAVFGSVARDEAGAESDIDLLVEFNEPVGLFEFARLQMWLEALLGRPVDLVTRDALRQSMRDQILSEAINAA